MKKKVYSVIVIVLVFLMFSCSTIQQDIEVYNLPEEQSLEIQGIEEQVVLLEAKSFLNKKSVTQEEANKLIKDINVLLGEINLQTAVQSKLLALQGRLYLITQRETSARECYEESTKTYKGEVQSVILGSRLGLIEDILAQGVAKSQTPLLTLEDALQLYKKEEYLQAVAKFDEAFISLEEFYRTAYEAIRNKAWELREITSQTSAKEADILKLSNINVFQGITLAQNAGDFLFKYLGSKKYTEEALVKSLVVAGLFNPLNADSSLAGNISSETKLTRILAARFLWNLYLERVGTPRDIKYATQFLEMGFSPIQDLPLKSPDFDAVLGCIENEIMELPDGINFFPNQDISGMDFNNSLKKIK